MKKLAFLVLFSFAGSFTQAATTYVADPAHSTVGFEVRHFFTPVSGRFNEYDAAVVFDKANPSNSNASATIYVKSIDTANAKRDDHLRSDDYFGMEDDPTITFQSTSWKQTGENTYEVVGDLTMLGETNEVTLDVEHLGTGEMRGNEVAGFTLRGTIDRSDWGLTAGQPVVGNEVDLRIHVEAIKQS